MMENSGNKERHRGFRIREKAVERLRLFEQVLGVLGVLVLCSRRRRHRRRRRTRAGVDRTYVQNGVDHVAAELVVLHVHLRRVCRNVYFARNVEQKGLVHRRTLHSLQCTRYTIHDTRYTHSTLYTMHSALVIGYANTSTGL